MAKEVEVRTKLKLDDLASAVLTRVQEQFKKTDEAQKETQDGFSNFASTFAAQFAAVNVAPLVGQVVDLGKAFFHAGVEAQSGDQAIAGLVAAAQGASWGTAQEAASKYGDQLDEIAVKAGQAAGDVGDAFQTMTEILGASNEGLQRSLTTTKDLTTISNVLGKTTQGLGQEYAFMAEGQLKMRGQLFQLLQQTGIFGDKTKGLAETWAKLTQEKRLELLEYGLGKAAKHLETASPTMGDLLTKLQNMATLVSEKFGEGFIGEVTDAFSGLLDELAENRGSIEGTAEEMGRDIGRFVKDAAKDVRAGFAYVRENYAEIRDTVKEGFGYAKSVVTWILEHKEALAFAFGAKTVLGLGQAALGSGVAQTAKSAVQGAASLGSAVAPALQGGALGGTIANLTTALGGATMGIAALGVGILALGGAAYATYKIIEASEEEYAAREAALQNIQEAALKGDIDRVKGLSDAMALLGEDVNSLGEVIGQLDETTTRSLQHLRGVAESVNAMQMIDAQSIENEIALASRGIADAYTRASTDTSKAGQDYAANMYANQTALLIDAYNQASKSGNNALATLAAQTLASSKGTQLAFLAAGQEVEGGFSALADVVAAGGSQFADFAAKLRSLKPKEAPTPAAPTVNIGSATFNIKQDFRDTDPDRVLVMFRKDLIKSAANRYTAATGSVFGT